MKLQRIIIIFVIFAVLLSACTKSGEKTETKGEKQTVNKDDEFEDLLLIETEKIKIYASAVFGELYKELRSKHGQANPQPAEELIEKILGKKINEYYTYEDAKENGFISEDDRENIILRYFSGIIKRPEIEKKLHNEIYPSITDVELEKSTPKTFDKLILRKIIIKTREEGEKVLKELKEGADFIEMVNKYSTGPSAKLRYGETDEFGLGSDYFTNTLDEEDAFNLKVGELYDGVIKGHLGYMVYKLEKKTAYDEEQIKGFISEIKYEIYNSRKREYISTVLNKYYSDRKIHKVELKKALEKYLKGENVNDVKVADIEDMSIRFEHMALLKNSINSRFFKNSTVDVCYSLAQDYLATLMNTLILDDYFQDIKLPASSKIQLNNMVRNKIARAYIESKIVDTSVSEEEMKKFYEDNMHLYTKKEKILVQIIFVPTREGALNSLKRYNAGEDFGKLAKELSTDEVTAPGSGLVGWVNEDNDFIPESVFDIMIKTKTGEISEPIETDEGGYIIFRIEDREEESAETLENSMNWTRGKALGKKIGDLLTEYYKEIKGNDKITRYEENIAEVLSAVNKKSLEKLGVPSH